MRCSRCEGKLKINPRIKKKKTIGQFEFVTYIPGLECDQCGETEVALGALGKFEELIVRILLKSGAMSPDVFQYMRRFLALSVDELSVILNVPSVIVECWEAGRQKIDCHVLAVLEMIVVEKIEGRLQTKELLKLIRLSRGIMPNEDNITMAQILMFLGHPHPLDKETIVEFNYDFALKN